MHLHYSCKHGQWALFLDRERLILFKKDCIYTKLEYCGCKDTWRVRLLSADAFFKMAVHWVFDCILQAFRQLGRLVYLKRSQHPLVNWSKMIIISDDIFSLNLNKGLNPKIRYWRLNCIQIKRNLKNNNQVDTGILKSLIESFISFCSWIIFK